MASVSHKEEESVYHVNYDKLIPKSPPKKIAVSPPASPMDGLTLSDTDRLPPSTASSVAGLRRQGSQSDLRLGLRKVASTSNLKRVDSASSLVQVRSAEHQKSLGIRSESVQDLERIRLMNEQTREEIGPNAGFDIAQIRGHYSHRALIRSDLPVFTEGRMWVLSVEPHFKDRIFCFARYTDDEIAIVVMNLKDIQDGDIYQAPCDVELKIQSLSEVLPHSLVTRFDEVHEIVDGFTGDRYGHELFTLEEFVFRKFTVHISPLHTIVLMPKRVVQTPERLREHESQALSRLELEASELKDPRENAITSRIARGAATSLSNFAKALNSARLGLSNMGLDEEGVNYQLQLCLQRASALHYNVLYEGAVPPRDYEPPRGERIISYLAHLTTAAESQDLLHVCRKLILRSQKIGPLVFLASELGRFSTAGGLGVMVDELTKDLAALGLEVYVVSPYYAVNRKGETKYIERDGKFRWTRNIDVNIGSGMLQVGVFEGSEDGVNLIFLERGDFFPKVYADPGSQQKLLETIVLMSLGSLEVLCQAGITPSVVVTNDWLPALAAGYAKNGFFGEYFNNTTFFHLIHNLGDGAYEGRVYPSPNQGNFEFVHRLPVHLLVDPWWQQKVVNPSRCAILASDSWGTVSPSYLKELRSSHPLKDALNATRRPFAYPNGIRKGAREELLRNKGGGTHKEAKRMLQQKYFNFQNADYSIPIFAFVGRVTSQKGVHMILNAVDELVTHTGGRIQIICGGPASQSDPYAAGCAQHMWHLRSKYPFAFWAAPSEFFTDGPLVNLGADFGLMPSVFEPGGIVQQEFFVGGTPVVAFKTGGLRDTVHEWNPENLEGNGFTFEGYSHGDFVAAVKRALRVFSRSSEYEELRNSAYSTTIDVSTVAWAWSSEFHRLRNAIYADSTKIHSELLATASVNDSCLVRNAKMVVFRWSTEGHKVFLKGSFDGWNQQWPLMPENEVSSVKLIRLRLPPGDYTYKFWVDGRWVLAEDQPRRDEGGFSNNVIVVE
uniref:Starch synthase n=1 Tax=Compsopogon caeruleus TaxID=31354 RepID=A0A7S1T5T0_9RHOD